MGLKLWSQPKNSNSRIGVWLWAGFFTFVLALVLVLSMLLLPSFERLEAKHLRELQTQANGFLHHQLKAFQNHTYDWAYWDDTYAYIQNRNKAYEQSNLDVGSLQTNNVRFRAYFDTEGNLVNGHRLDPKTQTMQALTPEQLAGLSDKRLRKEKGVLGLLELDELYLLSSQAILTSDRQGPVKGYLIMGQALDVSMTQNWSNLLGIEIEILPVSPTHRQPEVKGNRILMGQPLEDVYGRPVAELAVIHLRDIFYQGIQTLIFVAAAMILLGLGIVWVLHVMVGWLSRSQNQHLALEQRYRAVVEQASDGMMLVNTQTLGVLEINASLREMLGQDSPHLTQSGGLLSLSPAESQALIQRTLEEGRTHWGELQVQRPSGPLDVEVSASQISHGKERFVLVVVRDISARKQHQAQIEQMAYHDALTGLANRRQLHERTIQTLSVAERENWPLALLYLDLDRFKHVNDSLGHDAGDELLVMVADMLRNCVRQGDVLARLGGDEFAILLYQSVAKEAQQVAERVVDALRTPLLLRGQRVQLGVSVGIACYPDHGSNLVELLKAADIAMYQAKHAGGGFSFFDLEQNPYNAERMSLESALHQAIHLGEIHLHYQPVINLKTQRIEGFEGLARWQQQGAWIPPWSFVQVAEESNLIFDLDMLGLRTGLQQLHQWSHHPSVQLSLNLSALTLQRRELYTTVAQLLERYKVAPSQLTLEITETAAINNPQATYKVLAELKTLGVRLALDDFGNGYASLAYLRHLPIDRLKIDRTLIQHVGQNGLDEKLVLAAIMMGKSLGLEVVAEGVETQVQLEWLMAQGCDYAQGYWIGHPLPPKEAQAKLKPKEKAVLQ